MQAIFNNKFFWRWVISATLGINISLVGLGWLIYPSVMNEGGLAGIIADSVILLFYGFLALVSPISIEKFQAKLLVVAGVAGLVGGLGLTIDLVSAYLIEQNAVASSGSSLIAYSFFLVLIFGTAIFAGHTTAKVSAGLGAALWCVVVALLLWFLVEFTTFYLLASTPNGAKFIQFEMQADFQRSQSTDFSSFVMSDFYGAGFFHLLLGLILASLLGTSGGLLGKLAGNYIKARARLPKTS